MRRFSLLVPSFGIFSARFVTYNLARRQTYCLASAMRYNFHFRRQNIVLLVSLAIVVWIHSGAAWATSRPHVITFGKWTTVQWMPGISAEGKDRDKNKDKGELGAAAPSLALPLALKVRPLLVDARVKEFTLGPAHDVTDRLFVVRRAFRVNDSLPQESASPPHWQWQRGGWLLVDRVTGRISPINLPEFDVVYSDVIWYRDYAAYCGVSDDSKQIYAMVAQINRRKPIVKWLIEETKLAVKTQQWQIPDPPCRLPDWQRSPARVTFEANPSTKRTYVIRGHSVDLSTAEEDDEEAAK
jgi:hypothetical protein